MQLLLRHEHAQSFLLSCAAAGGLPQEMPTLAPLAQFEPLERPDDSAPNDVGQIGRRVPVDVGLDGLVARPVGSKMSDPAFKYRIIDAGGYGSPHDRQSRSAFRSMGFAPLT
ncbi:hypothetical protein GCM10009777_39630 [Microbacterium pumilum]|uniref:Uncharacterized protein n=1 Tax=Microbacterium pumilum TaxID=344165 RepID=A0ABP5EKU4_9MICO